MATLHSRSHTIEGLVFERYLYCSPIYQRMCAHIIIDSTILYNFVIHFILFILLQQAIMGQTTVQKLSINVDSIKGEDRKFICGVMLDQIKHNRTWLYPSSQYSKQYGVVQLQKERTINGKLANKNAKLILRGKSFDQLLKWAIGIATKNTTYYQANLAG